MLPFALLRPWLLARDLWVDRARPDLERLREMCEPERFLWAILPHAARTFSTCIALLPANQAKTAAVGYLYCRILDSYEDLEPDPARRAGALRLAASRLQDGRLAPLPPVSGPPARDARERAHLLLVEKHQLLDRVWLSLPAFCQECVRELVAAMAAEMEWASATFAGQGGALRDAEQLLRYCRGVLGQPVAFAARLIGNGRLAEDAEQDAWRVGELLQLANVTRDLEKDLERGVAYHPALRPWLGGAPAGAAASIQAVRSELFELAVHRAPAYPRLVAALRLPRLSLARASALLMLLYTERYYRGCAARAGRESWPGPERSITLLLQALPAVWSRRYGERRIEEAARRLAAAAVRGPEQATAQPRP